MNATDVIGLVALIVLILQNVTLIPGAVANLLRACLPVIDAARDLFTAIENPCAPTPGTDWDDDNDTDPS
ncbi:hypothetical protein ACFVVM_24630 [Nocardia sp. NPDC058176]|uniref:hypothetical protein n=1 Tax=Nocardia sp. NPDC058176 TaxID=3346368 RepID=UPI0036DA157B